MDWGLPQGEHGVASYRSDERTLFSWIRQMQPEKLDFNPHSYFNGTLLLFFLAGLYKTLSFFGVLTLSSNPSFYYRHVSEWAKFFWFGRLAMVLIAVASVWAVFKAGQLAFGKRVGLVAALLYAIVPLHVVSSKHLLVEPASTLWFASMLYFCFKIIREGLGKDYLGAALVLASACVVKITCAPLWTLLLFSHFLGPKKSKWHLSIWETLGNPKLWISTGVAIGVYFILNPYLLFNLDEAWREARFYYSHYHHAWAYLGYGPIFSLTHLIPYGFGPWFTFWGLAATFFSFFSKRREVWLTLLGLLVYFYLNARTGTVVVKYSVVLLPFITLLMGYFFIQLMERAPFVARLLGAFLFVWMILETLDLSLGYNRLFLRPDARDRASQWIREHIRPGAKIAVLQEPYWHSPPILYNQYFFSGQNRYWRVEPKYQVANLGYNEERVKTERPDYVVITGREIRLFQRSRVNFQRADNWNDLESFLNREGYKRIQIFENRLERGGVELPPGFPPDDWQQILLDIRIYQKV